MSFIKVSLVADQVAVLLGLSNTYSNQFIQHLEQKVKEAKSADEVSNIMESAVSFTRAKLDLDIALYTMLDEGEAREALDNKAPFEVLFLPAEHRFLSNVLDLVAFENNPATEGHTKEEIAKAKALVDGTSDALKASAEITAEQVRALQAEAAKATKSDEESLKGFFVQNKTGMA